TVPEHPVCDRAADGVVGLTQAPIGRKADAGYLLVSGTPLTGVIAGRLGAIAAGDGADGLLLGTEPGEVEPDRYARRFCPAPPRLWPPGSRNLSSCALDAADTLEIAALDEK